MDPRVRSAKKYMIPPFFFSYFHSVLVTFSNWFALL